MSKTLDLTDERRSRHLLVRALTDAGCIVKGSVVKCGFHDDGHPSGSIYVAQDGVWRFKCHACLINEDVIGVRARGRGTDSASILREMREQAEPAPPPKPKRVFPTLEAVEQSLAHLGPIEARYVYANPETRAPELVVIRHREGDHKSFKQYHPVPGGFSPGACAKPWPLYNRARVRAAEQVIVVEGEKAVHILNDLGIVATTSPCGAGKAGEADWRPLAGKTVYLWPDNDDPDPRTGRVQGVEHMRDVARALEALNPPPGLFWIPADQIGLPPKGDVEQFIQEFGGDNPKQDVLNLLMLAEPMGAAAELHQLLEDTISGKRRAIPWPWRAMSKLSKALLPGTVTILGGDPGSTKTFMLLEALTHWHREGQKVAAYMLEDNKADHLYRVLAQLADNGNITDDDWVRAHPGETREAFRAHRDTLDGLGRCLTVAPDGGVRLPELAEWVERRAADGADIIAVDPITAAETTDKPWQDDLRFLMRAKAAVRGTGARLILVTHPRKVKRTGTLDDLAGGAAYPRFAHTVFWVTKHDEPKPVRVATPSGPAHVYINRSVHVRKARNGRGAGVEIGFRFEGESLRFAEQGSITKEQRDPFAEEGAA